MGDVSGQRRIRAGVCNEQLGCDMISFLLLHFIEETNSKAASKKSNLLVMDDGALSSPSN